MGHHTFAKLRDDEQMEKMQRVGLRETLEFMLVQLVDHPEALTVKEVAGDNTIIFEVTLAETDVGKIIGREGATAMAIRKIMHCCAARDKKRCDIHINQ